MFTQFLSSTHGHACLNVGLYIFFLIYLAHSLSSLSPSLHLPGSLAVFNCQTLKGLHEKKKPQGLCCDCLLHAMKSCQRNLCNFESPSRVMINFLSKCQFKTGRLFLRFHALLQTQNCEQLRKCIKMALDLNVFIQCVKCRK